METIEKNINTHQRTFDQVMSIFILPEVQKRQNEKKIPKPFNLFAAQIIFRQNKKPLIRLNGETKVKFIAKVTKDTRIKKGIITPINKIEDIKKIELIEEDGNEAHITMIRVINSWKFTYDFRYNKQKARNIIEIAKEFSKSAKDDFNKKRWRPFIENLFLVTESLVKAELILHPIHPEAKTHNYWKSAYNKWYSYGNTEKEYKDLINELTKIRDHARYSENKFKIHHNKAKKFMQVVKLMFDRTMKRTTSQITKH